MSIRAVDPARSRLVLVGSPGYGDPLLPNLPEVARNLVDLAAVFTDPALGGFPAAHCVVAEPGASVDEIGDLLHDAAEQAEDLLLFYFAGHGLVGARGELYLALAGTRFANPGYSALRFETVRDTFLDTARALNRVVILDSCFSGRAIGRPLAGESPTSFVDELEISGTYTLASAPPNSVAMVQDGEAHTAFTGRLIQLLRDGDERAGNLLTLGGIYHRLRGQLQADGLPLPQQRGTATTDLLGIVRNRSVPLQSAPEPPERQWQLSPQTVRYVNLYEDGAAAVPVLELDDKTGKYGAVAFSPDGTLLATSGLSQAVRLWDPRTRRELDRLTRRLPGDNKGSVRSITFSPDGTILAAIAVGEFKQFHGTVQLWDIRARRRLGGRLERNVGEIAHVAFSPDGALLGTAGQDHTVRLWDPGTGDAIGPPLQGHTNHITSITFSPDGAVLLTASYDNTVQIWNPHTQQALGVLLRVPRLESAAFSPDGAMLSTTGLDMSVRLWDPYTRRELGALEGHAGIARAAVFSPDSALLATAGDDETVCLWDPHARRPVCDPLRAHNSSIHSAAFSPDGTQLATAGYFDRVRLWHIRRIADDA